jgi:Holliday junction resolvasome RuvABC endonuclease subunit
MITIGIRAAPREVTFAIYDSAISKVVNVEGIRVPAALSIPENLKYVRSNLLDILREYQVENAGVRTTEPNAQQVSIERIQIEGVIQEAFASSMLTAYFAGPIATIASKLKINRAAFKEIVDGDNQFDIENWDKTKANAREAILTAIGAVNV